MVAQHFWGPMGRTRLLPNQRQTWRRGARRFEYLRNLALQGKCVLVDRHGAIILHVHPMARDILRNYGVTSLGARLLSPLRRNFGEREIPSLFRFDGQRRDFSWKLLLRQGDIPRFYENSLKMKVPARPLPKFVTPNLRPLEATRPSSLTISRNREKNEILGTRKPASRGRG